MPNKTGRFHLYSDTSKYATGSALYKYREWQTKINCICKQKTPEASKSYSITELEFCSLAINIASFSHILKRVDFDAIVDHLALMHIIKSKNGTSNYKNKMIIGINQLIFI